jgi:hypothetical protein
MAGGARKRWPGRRSAKETPAEAAALRLPQDRANAELEVAEIDA